MFERNGNNIGQFYTVSKSQFIDKKCLLAKEILLLNIMYALISHLSCITGEMSPIGEGSISCGYLMYMYEGGIGGKSGGLRIPYLSRYNCSSNLHKTIQMKRIQ
jgi:hypothetical protein